MTSVFFSIFSIFFFFQHSITVLYLIVYIKIAQSYMDLHTATTTNKYSAKLRIWTAGR